MTVFCSIPSFAQPPKRAQVIGAIYEGDGTTATRNLKIVPVSNNVFGLYSDTTLELCTRVYLYFRTDFDSIESYRFSLKLLSTQFQINYNSTNTVYCRLVDISDSGVISNGVSVGSSIQLTKDSSNNILSWIYSGNNPDRDSFIVTIEFQNFMLGSNPLYFEVLDLTINGEATALSSGDQAIVEKLEDINNTLNYQYDPLEDLSQYQQQIVDNAGEVIQRGTSAANRLNNIFESLLSCTTLRGATTSVFAPMLNEFTGDNPFGWFFLGSSIACFLGFLIVLVRRRI